MADQKTGKNFGRKRQTHVYITGLGGERPAVPIDMTTLERKAGESMSKEAFAYIACGAGAERTVSRNREAFDRLRIVPRMMRDVSVRDTSIELFGRRLDSPFLLAPIGVQEMAHEEADLATARAAASEGVPMIFSNQASVPMERCAHVMGGAPRWFQLYWSKSDELVTSLVKRAEACGCEAIVVTLDTTMLGWRIQDLELAYLPFLRGKGIAQYVSDPVFRELLRSASEDTRPGEDIASKPKINLSTLKVLVEQLQNYPDDWASKLTTGEPMAAVQKFLNIYSRPSLHWDDLAFLREQTSLPIILKGIQHVDDARLAVEHGVDGIVVSNHGGRQVDGAIGSFDALPEIARAVGDDLTILFDSGVRTGADALKALAMGADAICIGRPYIYGLSIAGEQGVREVIQNFKADFDLTLGLSGYTSISELTPEALVEVR